MSEEKLAKINSEPAAAPNPSSIMSAPVAKKPFPILLAVIVGLVACFVLDIILLIAVLSKNEKITQLESDIKSEKAYVEELKEKLSSGNS